jgi:hypothetical protein
MMANRDLISTVMALGMLSVGFSSVGDDVLREADRGPLLPPRKPKPRVILAPKEPISQGPMTRQQRRAADRIAVVEECAAIAEAECTLDKPFSEMIVAGRIAGAIRSLLKEPNPMRNDQIEFEAEAIARALGEILPTKIDRQHIRQGARAFIDTVNALAEGGFLSVDDSANNAVADEFFGRGA